MDFGECVVAELPEQIVAYIEEAALLYIVACELPAIVAESPPRPFIVVSVCFFVTQR